jgi:hypothetical protein
MSAFSYLYGMNFRQTERAFCASKVTKASEPAIEGEKQSESELVRLESRSLTGSPIDMNLPVF